MARYTMSSHFAAPIDVPIPDEVFTWYEDNAKAAAAVMLSNTKGHMLATEAVPALIREVKRLRSIVVMVCSHPRTRDGRCLYCGASDDAETYRAAGDAITDGDTERLADIVNRDVAEKARRAAPDAQG